MIYAWLISPQIIEWLYLRYSYRRAGDLGGEMSVYTGRAIRMLQVKTRLDRSRVHGIGLFADEFIPEGTVIWEFHSSVDTKLTSEQIAQLSLPCQEQMRRYTYREKFSGKYVLCGDDARFFNHSADPNCIDIDNAAEGLTIARRNIYPGEELTCDYALFDLDLLEGKYQL